MNRLVTALFLTTFMMIATGSARAQVPYVEIYFDANLQQTDRNCGVGYDTLYVVAHNMNTEIASIEYQVYFTDHVFFSDDFVSASASIEGNSLEGIRISFSSPFPVFAPALVHRIGVLWFCSEACPASDRFPRVLPHPESGKVLAVRWSDLGEIEAVGMASSICAVLDTEETTWGRIKALYE